MEHWVLFVYIVKSNNLVSLKQQVDNRFFWLLWSVLQSFFFMSNCAGGLEKPTKITPVCCTLPEVTKYECVSLHACLGSTALASNSLAGRTKNG